MRKQTHTQTAVETGIFRKGLLAITGQIIKCRRGGREIPARKRWSLSFKHSERPNSWSQAVVMGGKQSYAVRNKKYLPNIIR
jgi:hypothetical protein